MHTSRTPIIDADNHYYEPDDAFTRHLEPEFATRSYHVRRDADGKEPPAQPPYRLFVGGVGGDGLAADGTPEDGVWSERDRVTTAGHIQSAMLDRPFAAQVGQELDERATAIHVQELRPQADPEDGKTPRLRLGQQRQLKPLPRGRDRPSLRMPRLAPESRIQIVSPREEHASSAVEDGADEQQPEGIQHPGRGDDKGVDLVG